ncbi:MAG: ACT domain-containing protein [Tissierellia bacterium]|nr:ACT domain-containing protein [Tissierellia bacterium]
MRAVITVIGKDRVGIVAEVAKKTAEFQLNIIDIAQTVLDGFFTMTVIVDLAKMTVPFQDVVDAFEALGQEMGLSIRVQHQGIFDAMHTI